MHKKFNWLSIFFIFLLFAIGGLVRSTGSGMGCPDWPKCFGEYIPPTSESALPDNYEEIYKEQRIAKTTRFTKLLRNIGFNYLAQQIILNDQINESHEFNAVKAYVEYINRLWGALTGVIVFICLLLSFRYLQYEPSVFWWTLLGFVSVFLNALLGAVVVHTNLIGGIVTAHFIFAFIAISAFIIARRYISKSEVEIFDGSSKSLVILLAVVSFFQILIGAGLREDYDLLDISLSLGNNITALNPNVSWHAIIAAIVMVMSILQFIRLSSIEDLKKPVRWIMYSSILQMILGPMALFTELAVISKLFHISFGALIFVLQFYICTTLMRVNYRSTKP